MKVHLGSNALHSVMKGTTIGMRANNALLVEKRRTIVAEFEICEPNDHERNDGVECLAWVIGHPYIVPPSLCPSSNTLFCETENDHERKGVNGVKRLAWVIRPLVVVT